MPSESTNVLRIEIEFEFPILPALWPGSDAGRAVL